MFLGTATIVSIFLLDIFVRASKTTADNELVSNLLSGGSDNSSDAFLDILNHVLGKIQNSSTNSSYQSLPNTTFSTVGSFSYQVTQEGILPLSAVDNHEGHGIIDAIQNIIDNDTALENKHIISTLLHSASNLSVTNTDVLEKFVETTALLLNTDKIKDQVPMEDVMKTMESLVSVCAVNSSFSVTSDVMDVEIILVSDIKNSPQVIFSHDTNAQIEVSNEVFGENGGKISTIVYKNIDKTLPDYEGASVSSVVVSVTINVIQQIEGTDGDRTGGVVVLILPTELKDGLHEKQRWCVYWSFETSEWSRDGCSQREKNLTHTTCVCTHFTNFAVLVEYYEPETVSDDQRKVLDILTTVGCGLSIAGLVMTLLVYVYFRILQRQRIMLHANLAIALLLAQLVFITSQDVGSNNKMLCRAVAVMLHYLFMSAFSWMLVEGVALYISCTKSLNNMKDVRLKYFMIGWGVPVIVVLVSLGIEFQDYGTGPENSCWLSAENGLIWAFMGPMVLIVLFNVIVLAMVIKVFLTLKANARKSEAERIRCSIRAMILLLPILGVTWLLSLLVPISSAFHFLFVIGNSIQGLMIFFLHCVCNEEVRKKFREKRRKLMSRRTSSETDVSYVVARRPPLIFMEDLANNAAAGLPPVG